MNKNLKMTALFLLSMLSFNINTMALTINSYFAVTSTECTELLGPGSMSILRTAIAILRWAVPIVLIATSSLDFIKVIVDKDPTGSMKKAQKSVITRVIIAVIIFLLPGLLNLLLSFIDTSTCGL